MLSAALPGERGTQPTKVKQVSTSQSFTALVWGPCIIETTGLPQIYVVFTVANEDGYGGCVGRCWRVSAGGQYSEEVGRRPVSPRSYRHYYLTCSICCTWADAYSSRCVGEINCTTGCRCKLGPHMSCCGWGAQRCKRGRRLVSLDRADDGVYGHTKK
jgi:hypothetical protein